MLDERQLNLERRHPQESKRSRVIAHWQDLCYSDPVTFFDTISSLAPSATIEPRTRKPEAASPPLKTQTTPEPTEIEPIPPVEVYTAYVDSDGNVIEKIKVLYDTLRRQKYHVTCHASEVTENFAWQQQGHLKTAELIILLVGPNFLNTDFCYHKQMYEAVDRHKDKRCYVIPILVRPTSARLLRGAPFGELEFLPGRGKAVPTGEQQDEVFEHITDYILDKIDRLKLLG